MKKVLFVGLGIVFLIAGCKKNGSNPVGPPQTGEDWTFPPGGNKFAVTLVASTSTPAVGSSFDVNVVLYNCSQVFGVSLKVGYAADKVHINEILTGPYLSPDTAAISISKIDSSFSTVSYGATFKAGSASAATTAQSGVLVKLKCTAKQAGSAPFTLAGQEMHIETSDGSPVPGFASIALENDTVAVQ